MSSIEKNLLYLVLLGTALAVSACKQNKQEVLAPTSAPSEQAMWNEQPIAVPPQAARPVKEGPPPLTYMVESDSIVRVADLTDKVDLLTMPVMARQIVTVNPDAGVQISGATMRMGVLPRDHRYGIFLQNNSENIMRTGKFQPGQTPDQPVMPRSQP